MAVMAPQPQRAVYHEFMRGAFNPGPFCKTPGRLWRLWHRVHEGYEWGCTCGQWWRWGVNPSARLAGFTHREWVRCL